MLHGNCITSLSSKMRTLNAIGRKSVGNDVISHSVLLYKNAKK